MLTDTLIFRKVPVLGFCGTFSMLFETILQVISEKISLLSIHSHF